MIKRFALVLVAVVMVMLASCVGPATAGTADVPGPSGSFGHAVNYHDFYYTPAQKPMGEWQPVSVHANPDRDCAMAGKWGNYPDGFAQFKQTGGSACVWGGIRITVFYDGPGTANDGLTSVYSNGDYCVGTSTSSNAIYCTQLADGSIFLERTPGAGATMRIVSAEFVVCASRGFGSLAWECNHDHYAIAY